MNIWGGKRSIKLLQGLLCCSAAASTGTGHELCYSWLGGDWKFAFEFCIL